MIITTLLVVGGAALVAGTVSADRSLQKRRRRREAERKRLTPMVDEAINEAGIPLPYRVRPAPRADTVGRLCMSDRACWDAKLRSSAPAGFILDPNNNGRVCCGFTHEEFYKRHKTSGDGYINHQLWTLEEIVGRDGVCEYLLIGWFCNVCGHFAPNPDADVSGSIYAAGIVRHNNLFVWLESFDRAAVLTARRENLERQLDEVRLQLLNAAQANPTSLGHHPLREHPTLLLTGTKGKTA